MSFNLDVFKEELSRVTGTNKVDYLKDFVKFPTGEGYVVVRILEPHPNCENIYVALRNHTINKKRMQCSRELVGGFFRGECPICTEYNGLWEKSKNPSLTGEQVKDLQSQARSIKPVDRYFYNCIVRQEVDDKGVVKTDVGPKILSIGKELHTYVIRSIVGDPTKNKKGYGDITDVAKGRDLNIVKSLNDGGFATYIESEFLEPSVLHEDPKVIKEWLAALHDLKSKRKPRTYEELVKEVNVFRGLEQPEDESFNKVDFETPTQPKQEKTVVRNEKAVEAKPVMEDADLALVDDDFLKDFDLSNIN